MERGVGGRISLSVFRFLSLKFTFVEKKYFNRRCRGSGDGSLTHFFVNPLDNSVTYSRESGQLANPNPIYKGCLKNLIAVFARKSLNLKDIRMTTRLCHMRVRILRVT